MFNKLLKKINPISAISNKLRSDEDDKQNEDLNNQVLQFEVDPMENLPSVQVYNPNNKPEEEITEYILPKQNEKVNQKLQRQISKEIEKDMVQNKDDLQENEDYVGSSGSDYEYVEVTDSDQDESVSQKIKNYETQATEESKRSGDDLQQEYEVESKNDDQGTKKKMKIVKRKKDPKKKQKEGIQRDQDGNVILEEKQGKKYIKYKVKKEDTLYNICDFFNINVGMVMKINDMVEEHIFPGKLLDILVTEDNEYILKQQQSQIKDTKRAGNHTQRQQQIILEEMKKQKERKQYTVLYCTQIGNILGELKIEDKVITFTPDPKDQDNQQNMKKRPGIKFNVIIDLKDINEAFNIVLPPQTSNDEEIQEGEHDYTVQVCLSTINKEISVKYKEKLEKLKRMKKSISFVDFKIYEYNIHGHYLNSDMKKNIADFIVDDINSALPEDFEVIDIPGSQTVVPFYDILYENLIEEIEGKQDDNEKKDQKRITIWDTLGVTPNFDGESRAVNNEQMLEIIEFCVPNHFRLSNWALIYSNWKHGTSINTCFRNCEYIEPCILIIEEFNGNVFGAYLSEYIKTGFKFYGTAECCVFRIVKEKVKGKIEAIKRRKAKEQMKRLKQSKSLENIEGMQSEGGQVGDKKKYQQNRQSECIIGQRDDFQLDDSILNENDNLKEESKQQDDQEKNNKLLENEKKSSNGSLGKVQGSEQFEGKEIDSQEKLNKDQEQEDENSESDQEEDQNQSNLENSEKFDLEYYTYTGKNENYMFADHEGIGIGGGDKYSIFINSNFTEGLSNYSDTFDNPRLSVFESYNIKNIEVWGVVYNW